ncbi:CRISPR-associated helicase Cas3' [Herbidospora sp. NBRC 101105]|uniref:CRISPR-associated helicase Cas3' n=1 Tax=Herbidospora sp. NBRC 101105 TaxID=3032195 RepID=UPI0024A13515|nr:CRISPR-associated helicase Cas3' [Herbidospora sp. NBRC 101105]GLX95036.1 CRISPR-associated helicase/endonuclease Cas3 [Herbidospora sp. NBRC 101105]
MTPVDLKSVYAKSRRGGRPQELLTDHLADTHSAARQVSRRVGTISGLDDGLQSLFWPAVELAGLTHDGGKIPTGFQDMLAGRVRMWGERHEVLSLGFLPSLIENPDLLLWVATAVATHHRPLDGDPGRDLMSLYGNCDIADLQERIGPIHEQIVPELEEWFREKTKLVGLPVAATVQTPLDVDSLLMAAYNLLDVVLNEWDTRSSADRGLSAVLLQGAVTLADHLSSAHQHLSLSQPLDGSFRALLDQRFADQGRALRPHQVKAETKLGHLLLQAPTGSGKTEAVLLWAANQVTDLAQRTGGVPRVFFVLPYLSSINAMADRLEDLFQVPGTVGVAHSKAASYHLAASIAPEDGDETDQDNDPCRVDAATKAVSRAAATKLFRESVRVATPYQLMRAALAGPAHSGILIDAANSVFVLDELHVYDPQRLGCILASTRLWERLGGRIAVVSATLPDALSELFTQTLTQPVSPVDAAGFDLPSRHRLRTRDHHLMDPAALDEIRSRLIRDESVLVVANNVAQALELFEELGPGTEDLHGEGSALLLHSRFRRGDRNSIERSIRSRFGAGLSERRPGLLIATQCVEVSLDLDFDVLLTAAAPLEALLQRFGRVNRLAARPPADVIVHLPNWTTRRNAPGTEYADGIYAREPVEAAWELLVAHSDTDVDEADATAWLNLIYATHWGAAWREEVQNYYQTFTDRLLTFRRPFDSRSDLAAVFDELFDGSEAILAEDRDAYADALAEAPGQPRAGRLLADEYLLPLPYWAGPLSGYDKKLQVRVIHGDYDPRLGLRSISGPAQITYQPGEVL